MLNVARSLRIDDAYCGRSVPNDLAVDMAVDHYGSEGPHRFRRKITRSVRACDLQADRAASGSPPIQLGGLSAREVDAAETSGGAEDQRAGSRRRGLSDLD